MLTMSLVAVLVDVIRNDRESKKMNTTCQAFVVALSWIGDVVGRKIADQNESRWTNTADHRLVRGAVMFGLGSLCLFDGLFLLFLVFFFAMMLLMMY